VRRIGAFVVPDSGASPHAPRSPGRRPLGGVLLGGLFRVIPLPLRRRYPELAIAALLAGVLVTALPGPQEVAAQAPSSDAARAAQEAASDPDTPGPVQPIPFNHALHAGQYGIQCLYCHTGTDRARYAGMPSVEVCMGCHAQFGGDLEGVKTLKEHWDQKQPIEWVQIHRLPEYVKFRHNRHIAAGIECQKCHGQVQEMDKVYLVPDTIWWPWLLPAKKLEMGWCINCHRENGASQDCLLCHY
jgi:hypothetical protein